MKLTKLHLIHCFVSLMEHLTSFSWIFWFSINTLPIVSGNLVQIHVVFRYGARTPAKPYPNSPFPKPIVPSQLTTNGMSKLYNLGKRLKDRYISGDPFHFLPPRYNGSQILVNSSMTSRTMESAYCLLAGMYPPQGKQIWNPHLLWQPIPVYTRDPWEDPVCNPLHEDLCPKMKTLRTQEFRSGEVLNITLENKVLFDYLSEKTGQEKGSMNPTAASLIFDNLVMEKEEGILSEWANHEWIQNVTVMDTQQLYMLVFKKRYINGHLKNLLIGNLIQNITNSMKNHIKSNSSARGYFYSMHEEKLGPLLACFDLFDSYVNLGSVLIFELFANNGNYGVKLVYKDGHADQFHYLRIPGCGESDLCPLGDFEKIIKPCVLEDWRQMCEIEN